MEKKIFIDKDGKCITYSEFMTRWKEGIKNITPLQQSKILYHNNWMMLIGLLCGVVITSFNFSSMWWVTIILVAGFINTLIIQIGNYQKYCSLLDLENLDKTKEYYVDISEPLEEEVKNE